MNPRFSFRAYTSLFLLILGVYLLLSPAHFLTSPDEELNLRTVLSFLHGHGGAIPTLEGFASKTGKNGLEYAQYGLGLPWFSLPWCALGLFLDPTPDSGNLNSLDFSPSQPNASRLVGTPFLRGWMTGFSMIVTALTVVLVFSIVQRIGVSPGNALFLVFLLAFGSYTWPHGRTFFTEPLAAFCLTAAVGCFLQWRESTHPSIWIVLAGCFWAYAVLTRIDSLITAPAAAWLLFTQRNQNRIQFHFEIKNTILFSIPWIAVFTIILGYNVYRFGSIVSTGYEDQPEKIRFLTPILVGLQGFLFTPGRSLFLYSPPFILALWGIRPAWKKDAWFAGGIILLIVSYLMVMSKWQNWAGGYDWGPRHIYQITPFLAILAAASLSNRTLFDRIDQRIGWAVLILVSFFMQFMALSVDSVLIIKWFLARMSQSFPEASVNQIMPYLLQLPIYLPQFSSPALHWQWICDHGPNFLLLNILADRSYFLFLFLIPAGCVGWGLFYFWKLWKPFTQKSLD